MGDDANEWLKRFYEKMPRYASLGATVFFLAASSIEVSLLGHHVAVEHQHVWESIEHLLLEFVALFAAAALVRPIEQMVVKLREMEAKKDLEVLRTDIRKFDTREIPPAVIGVKPYEDLNWSALLGESREVDLALVYCSSGWLEKNIGSFSDFVKKGNALRLYLPPWDEFSTEFYGRVTPTPYTLERLLKTVAWFRHECVSDKNTAQIKELSAGLGHVVAVLRGHGDESRFIFSPFPFGLGKAHLPPAVILDERTLSEPLKKFVEDIRGQLKDAKDYRDLEKSHYLTWDPIGNRVFVSVALSCSLNCDFCYIKSIIKDGRLHSAENFGEVLAFAVLGDPRFHWNNAPYTRVLIGGFTEPFLGPPRGRTDKERLPSNADYTVQFINTLTETCRSNYIHVATRSSNVSDYVDELKHPERIVFNYSVSSYAGKTAETREGVRSRLEDAKRIIKKGKAHIALYVRPVLPGQTLRDVEDFAPVALESGMIHATVGGLYADNEIEARLKSSGLPGLPEPKKSAKEFILAPGSKLRKLAEDEEIEKVKDKLRRLGFKQAFGSSTELLNHLADDECRTTCGVGTW